MQAGPNISSQENIPLLRPFIFRPNLKQIWGMSQGGCNEDGYSNNHTHTHTRHTHTHTQAHTSTHTHTHTHTHREILGKKLTTKKEEETQSTVGEFQRSNWNL